MKEIKELDDFKRKEKSASIRASQIEILKYITSLIKDKCDTSNDDSCTGYINIRLIIDEEKKKIADQKLNKEKEELDNRKKISEEEMATKQAKNFDVSPDGIKKKACEAFNNISHADQLINREKKVAEASGFINKNSMH